MMRFLMRQFVKSLLLGYHIDCAECKREKENVI